MTVYINTGDSRPPIMTSYNIVDGTVQQQYTGHAMMINDMKWNTAGDRLASISLDGTTKVWGPDSSTPLHTLNQGGKNSQFCWSSCGEILVISDMMTNNLNVWDTTNWQYTKCEKNGNVPLGNVRILAIHPSSGQGQLKIATCDIYDTVITYDISSYGKAIETNVIMVNSAVKSISFSPDGDLLAVGEVVNGAWIMTL